MANSKVIRTSLSTVVPAQSLPISTHFLSSFDQLFASIPMYMETAYCFRAKPNCEPMPSMQSLKASLSKVLSIYPLFAGRLKESAPESGRFEIELNGEGVPFEEAEADASLDEWPDLRNSDLMEELLSQNLYVADLFTAPLIRVQFTKFKCGGMALGLSELHVIADGQATIEFMKAWGEIHRGMEPSFSPLFHSTKLRARNPPAVNIPSADEVLHACIPVIYNQTSFTIPSDRFKNVYLRIDREELRKCKEDVQNGPFSYGPVSTFEALSGLLWTLVTRARNLEETARTTHVFPMNLRAIWQPPLPAGFVGNAVFMNHASATVKEIRSNHFSFAASLMHERVKMVNSEFAHSVADWIEVRLHDHKPINVGFNASAGTDFINSSFTYFPVYQIDFGQTIDHFDPIIRRKSATDGIFYILPSPPSCVGKHCRDVKLRLREDHLENMLRDPDFQLYFQQYSPTFL